MAQGYKGVTVKRVVGSIATERMNYYLLILHFFALAPRQKLGVETQQAISRKIRRKVDNGVS